jgi:hypothetical protein
MTIFELTHSVTDHNIGGDKIYVGVAGHGRVWTLEEAVVLIGARVAKFVSNDGELIKDLSVLPEMPYVH